MMRLSQQGYLQLAVISDIEIYFQIGSHIWKMQHLSFQKMYICTGQSAIAGARIGEQNYIQNWREFNE